MTSSRIFLIAFAVMAALFVSLNRPAPSAEAHPLGNFTINRLSLISLDGSGSVSLRYIVDMAEIPAFQEIRSADKDGDSSISDAEAAAYVERTAPALERKLSLEIGGQAINLASVGRGVTFPEGQGGLKTLHLSLDLQGALPGNWQAGSSASFKDDNHYDRIGWKDVVISGTNGAGLTASSAALSDVTAGLTEYPTDRLKSPPSVSSAEFSFHSGPTTITAPTQVASSKTESAPGKSLDTLSGFVTERELTPIFVILSLLAAAAWGAAHALGPGHGKTIVAAYLVGSRGTAKHAVILGITVTLTHTISVVTLGLVTLVASHYFPTEHMYRWLAVASGLLVAFMGAGLLAARLRKLMSRWSHTPSAHHHHEQEQHDHTHSHDHDHSHAHDHDNGHSHEMKGEGLRGLIALGISGGIVPCPTALVVMLASIAVDRTAYGLVVVFAFGVGLAAVLTVIGIVLVYAKRFFNEDRVGSRFPILRSGVARRAFASAPVLSAFVILGAGLVLTQRALASL